MPSAVSHYQRDAIAAYLATLPAISVLPPIVLSPAVQAKLATFEAADASALRFQSRFRRISTIALWATTIGTLIGALLLFPRVHALNGLPRSIIAVLQTAALIVAFISIQWIGRRKPVEAWMVNRAEAERLRGEIFEAVLDEPAPTAADTAKLAAEKLGLLLAGYGDDQLTYFRRAAERHARAARRLTPLRMTGYLLLAVAVAMGGVATLHIATEAGLALPEWLQSWRNGVVTNDPGLWQLGLGTMASCLIAHASTRALMDQNERIASLYSRTAAKLELIIAERYAGTQTAAAEGDASALYSFLDHIRDVLEQEHAAWLQNRRASDPLHRPEPRIANVV